MSSASGRSLHWTWLGRRPYGPIFEWQEETRRRLKAGEGPERLLLLEHEPVFTLGRNARADDVVADDEWILRHGVEIHESNRGGQVTYHGPGQLVAYPIIDLNPDRRDIGRYVRDLQESVISTLAELGLAARRREGKENIGVWVGDAKIASIGVHLSRWIPIHGLALNVTTRLDHFRGIVACGLPDVSMTSIDRLLGEAPALPDLATLFAMNFARIFERRLVPESAETLNRSMTISRALESSKGETE